MSKVDWRKADVHELHRILRRNFAMAFPGSQKPEIRIQQVWLVVSKTNPIDVFDTSLGRLL